TNHGFIGKLLYESEIALNYNMYIDKSVLCFDDIGIYQILIPMLNQPIQSFFYKEIIDKIITYDAQNNSELLATAIAYIHSDANIKLTSSILFQHENTIRFRIRKLKEVIGYNSFAGEKYERLSLAIRLYELNQKFSTNQ
ncbi:helix-turn-helix domain-containing protein, partial [Clostridiaceae bacterium HSG29]|nr:helix-turn-helix domain-containing protein [Clostridiaceae bacterium HSG29]